MAVNLHSWCRKKCFYASHIKLPDDDDDNDDSSSGVMAGREGKQLPRCPPQPKFLALRKSSSRPKMQNLVIKTTILKKFRDKIKILSTHISSVRNLQQSDGIL